MLSFHAVLGVALYLLLFW